MVARRAHNPEVGGPSPPSATEQEVNPNGWPLIVFPPHISSHHIQQPITHLFKHRNSETNIQAQLTAHISEHKNPDFVLEKPENWGPEGKKSTKTSILCSGSPKTGVPKAKKHKNLDFVLEMPENGGSKAKKAQKCRFCAREGKSGKGKKEKDGRVGHPFPLIV